MRDWQHWMDNWRSIICDGRFTTVFYDDYSCLFKQCPFNQFGHLCVVNLVSFESYASGIAKMLYFWRNS
jgi:hypothetical protein